MNTRSSAFISKSDVLQLVFAILLLTVMLGFSSCMMPFLSVMDSVSQSSDADAAPGDGDPSAPEGGGDRGDDGSGSIQPLMVTVRSDEFTLAWDAPEGGGTVDSYQLHYREYGGQQWLELGSVNSDQLDFEVNQQNLGDGWGQYEFAVQSIDPEGTPSEYHTSVCSTAQPETGWYVNWQPPL